MKKANVLAASVFLALTWALFTFVFGATMPETDMLVLLIPGYTLAIGLSALIATLPAIGIIGVAEAALAGKAHPHKG